MCVGVCVCGCVRVCVCVCVCDCLHIYMHTHTSIYFIKGGMTTHQFDDLYQHPVVTGSGKQLEEDRSQ